MTAKFQPFRDKLRSQVAAPEEEKGERKLSKGHSFYRYHRGQVMGLRHLDNTLSPRVLQVPLDPYSNRSDHMLILV